MASIRKTKIEQYVIDKVKYYRIENGFSQEGLAAVLDTTRGFIGQIESHKHNAKYNMNHLNTLATEFNISMKDFFPDKPFKDGKRKAKK